MRRYIKPLLRYLSSLKEVFLNVECFLSSRWVSNAHKRLMRHQWSTHHGEGSQGHGPGYFEHDFNLYYTWKASRDPTWVERGVFGRLALKGGDLLELSCGDGFNTRNFYSLFARHIIALDIDPKAIDTARRKHNAPNIEYRLADMREGLPMGRFSNIVWDGGMEYMTLSEIHSVIRMIKTRLIEDGIFSGYVIVAQPDDFKSPRYKHLLRSKAELPELLAPYFKNIIVFETMAPQRHNLYFWASDALLPKIQTEKFG
jgi:hypothetical protein